jgi:hypothetical protein
VERGEGREREREGELIVSEGGRGRESELSPQEAPVRVLRRREAPPAGSAGVSGARAVEVTEDAQDGNGVAAVEERPQRRAARAGGEGERHAAAEGISGAGEPAEGPLECGGRRRGERGREPVGPLHGVGWGAMAVGAPWESVGEPLLGLEGVAAPRLAAEGEVAARQGAGGDLELRQEGGR